MNENELKDLHDAIWRQIYEEQRLTLQRNQASKNPADMSHQKGPNSPEIEKCEL